MTHLCLADYHVDMSTAEILAELPRLSPHDRQQIARRLAELEAITLAAPGDWMSHDIAGETRAKLECFAEEWESPEMSPYDNYDASLAKLQSR